MATRKRTPSALQEAFVDAKMEGKSDSQAAVAAGCLPSAGSQMAASPTIKEQLALARQFLSDTTQIKRLDVVEGLMDGISMARMQGDSGNVIKGWTEIAKILGHYAPEVKKIELSISQERLRSKFEALNDEELLALAEGSVVEGEYKEVH
jgi:hypothetical protein